MYKSILVAVDGSDHARKASEFATDLAKLYGAELHVVHALAKKVPESLQHMAELEHLIERRDTQVAGDHPANTPAGLAGALHPGADAKRLREAARAVGDLIVGDARRRAEAQGVSGVHCSIEEGDAARAILEYAKRNGCDLLVLGSRGLGDLGGLMLGSVSHKVMQLAEGTCVAVK